MSLEVGDRVEVMNVWSQYMGLVGKVLEVKTYDKFKTCHCKVLLDKGKVEQWFASTELKKSEVRVPKIGDRVVVTSSTSDHCGMRGEVKHHSEAQHKSWLFFDALSSYAWFDDADLAVVFEDSMSRKENEMELTIGTRVKIMPTVATLNAGKEGVIVDCSTLRAPKLYKVKLDADSSRNDSRYEDDIWYDASSLEVVGKKVAPSMFKIGDKVIINEKCTAYKDLVGKRGTIADVIEGRCRVNVGNSHYVWITDEVLSLDNARELKVGDKVIVCENVPHYGGCKGKVLDAYGSIKTYVVEVLKNGFYCSRTFLEDELTLDNDELRRADVKMMKHFRYVRWEVGDKVIIHSNDCNGIYFGRHGTIVVANPLGNYRVKLEDTGNYDWFAGSDLSRDISGAEQRKKGSDVWHVNVAELAGRTVSGCKGLAFGEED